MKRTAAVGKHYCLRRLLLKSLLTRRQLFWRLCSRLTLLNVGSLTSTAVCALLYSRCSLIVKSTAAVIASSTGRCLITPVAYVIRGFSISSLLSTACLLYTSD